MPLLVKTVTPEPVVIATESRLIQVTSSEYQMRQTLAIAEVELRVARERLHNLQAILDEDTPMVRSARRKYEDELSKVGYLRGQVQVAAA